MLEVFKFPREHGLIMIWSSSLLLAIIVGLNHYKSPTGLIIGILFSLFVIFSYNSLKSFLEERKIEAPLVSVVIISFSAFIIQMNIYSLFFFSLLFLFVVIWATHYFFLNTSRRMNNYSEIILGSIALTLQFPIIYNLIAHVENQNEFLTIMAIWWLYLGVALILVLAVGCYRQKINHMIPLYFWLLYLLTVAPMFLLDYLHPIFLLLLIDPTSRSMYHATYNPTFRKNRIPVKRVGIALTASVIVFLIIIQIIFLLGLFPSL